MTSSTQLRVEHSTVTGISYLMIRREERGDVTHTVIVMSESERAHLIAELTDTTPRVTENLLTY